MTGLDRIADYMVRGPACACMWHPLSFIRQTMLSSSFSFLPVNAGSGGISRVAVGVRLWAGFIPAPFAAVVPGVAVELISGGCRQGAWAST